MCVIKADGTHYMQAYPESSRLTQYQHGFRKSHSCESQLLLTVNDLMCSYDRKIQTDIAVLNFSRAFDTVPHERLLGKLDHYDIGEMSRSGFDLFCAIGKCG